MPPTQQFQPDQLLTASLSAQEWNTVFAALQEIPFKFASPIIEKLHASLMAKVVTPPQTDEQVTQLRPPNGDGRQVQTWTPEEPPPVAA